MASVLSGVVSPQLDLVGSFTRGQQAYNQNQLAQQQMQQNQLQQQRQQQQIGDAGFQSELNKLRVIGGLAVQARQMPPEQRQQFAASIDPAFLQNAGIDPAGMQQVDLSDQGLDNLIATARGALQGVGEEMGQNTVQQGQYIPGVGYAQQLRDGSVRVQQFAPEERNVIAQAMEADAQRRAQEAAGKAGAVLDVKIDKEPTLTDLKTRAGDSASQSVKKIGEYAEQLNAVNQGIANFDEGIRLIDEGANTGAIQSRLPSIRANAIRLDNLRNRLGLDVVGATTFGALSEAELKMALDTALPTNLPPADLRKWLEERKIAQQKLASSISQAIEFLNQPGATLADLHEYQKNAKAQQQQPAQPSIDDLLRMY